MSMDETMSPRDEMEALLPFYLNGTLTGDDLKRVEDWLASDPDAMAALGEAEDEFSGSLAANEAVRPPADALRRFNAMLDREAGPERASQSSPSLLASLWDRFMGLPKEIAWAAAAVAIAVLVVQAVVVATTEPGRYEVAGAESGDLPFILVTFTPDARIADVAAALDEAGASLAGGPLPGGMFRIAIPVETAADYDRIAAIIADAPFVATFTPGRRPADEK